MFFQLFRAIIFLNCIGTSVVSALTLELTQGVAHRIPLLVVPFSRSDGFLGQDISTFIAQDLNHSGQFNVINPQTKPSLESLWSSDRLYGANDLVLGEMKRVGTGQYRVHFELIHLAREQRQILDKGSFFVNPSFNRYLAHRISDRICEKLTGIRGVFSTRIAYVLVTMLQKRRVYNLQIADMDGYNAHSLLTSSQPIMSPTWSHDAKKIAYVSFEKVMPRIYVQTIATGRRELVSAYSGINGAPAWSPDDKTLAVALTRDSTTPKIYLLNLSSKKLRQVTFGFSIDTEPSWSPDGTSLLFTSDRGGTPQIYQLDLHTQRLQRITFEGNYNTRASFAPDGKMIVVLNRKQGMYNIAIQKWGSSIMEYLTHSGYDASPSFSPNGQIVLYESKPNRSSFLGMISIDRRVHCRLPAPEGEVQDPTWSPFLSS